MSAALICLVGCDGSGKSTLARFIVDELRRRGYRPVLLWSRYNHFFSKPLLAVARLLGYSPKEVHDGTTFGYHDFYRASWLKWSFIVLQIIDVNLAICKQLRAARRKGDVVVFERSPWDTLADIMLDTRHERLGETCWGRWIVASMAERSTVFWVQRDFTSILLTRPELRFDRDLRMKMRNYESLALTFAWNRIINSGKLEDTQESLVDELTKMGYHG
jgi:hypothetical protein